MANLRRRVPKKQVEDVTKDVVTTVEEPKENKCVLPNSYKYCLTCIINGKVDTSNVHYRRYTELKKEIPKDELKFCSEVWLLYVGANSSDTDYFENESLTETNSTDYVECLFDLLEKVNKKH